MCHSDLHEPKQSALPKQRALLRLMEVGTSGSTRQIAERTGLSIRTVQRLVRR